MNRRRRLRAPFETRVRFWVAGEEVLYSASKDLSLGGVYLFTPRQPEPGIRGEVEIVLSLGEKTVTLPMLGEVIRRDEKGIGLRFLSMTPTVFDHLKKVLYYNTGDPDRVDSELIRFPFDFPPGAHEEKDPLA